MKKFLQVGNFFLKVLYNIQKNFFNEEKLQRKYDVNFKKCWINSEEFSI